MSQRLPSLRVVFSLIRTMMACGTGALGALLVGCNSQTAAVTPPGAVKVTVSTPLEREVIDFEDFTGHTEAVESVDVRARVTGYLDKIFFKEGSEVQRGDLLFQIDPRPFQAELDRAAAQVKLRQANLKFRKGELERSTLLLQKSAISQSDFDQVVSAYEEAVAALAAGRAGEESAKLNLDFTKIASPIDGRISRTSITVGNLVLADNTLLTTVVSVDPMYAYFDVDERTILRIEQDLREGKIKAQSDQEIPVLVGLANEEGFPHQGTLDFADNRVDASTGTIQARGVFANPKPNRGNRLMLPGLFVRVRVPVGEPRKALVVTERALGTDQGQKYLLIADEKNGVSQVRYRPVKVGKLDDGLRVIEEGVKAEDRVIVNGLQRVREGSAIQAERVDMESFAHATRLTDTAPAKHDAAQPSAAKSKPQEPSAPQSGAEQAK